MPVVVEVRHGGAQQEVRGSGEGGGEAGHQAGLGREPVVGRVEGGGQGGGRGVRLGGVPRGRGPWGGGGRHGPGGAGVRRPGPNMGRDEGGVRSLALLEHARVVSRNGTRRTLIFYHFLLF